PLESPSGSLSSVGASSKGGASPKGGPYGSSGLSAPRSAAAALRASFFSCFSARRSLSSRSRATLAIVCRFFVGLIQHFLSARRRATADTVARHPAARRK